MCEEIHKWSISAERNQMSTEYLRTCVARRLQKSYTTALSLSATHLRHNGCFSHAPYNHQLQASRDRFGLPASQEPRSGAVIPSYRSVKPTSSTQKQQATTARLFSCWMLIPWGSSAIGRPQVPRAVRQPPLP